MELLLKLLPRLGRLAVKASIQRSAVPIIALEATGGGAAGIDRYRYRYRIYMYVCMYRYRYIWHTEVGGAYHCARGHCGWRCRYRLIDR